jgi:hypothetical protein
MASLADTAELSTAVAWNINASPKYDHTTKGEPYG